MLIFIIGNGSAALSAPPMGSYWLTPFVAALAHRDLLRCRLRHRGNSVRPEKRASAVSVMMAGLTIANILGVPLGTYIGQHLGWRASFGSVVLMGIIFFIDLLIFIPQITQKTNSSLTRQVRSLLQPRLLLVFLIGALGCSSCFAVFTLLHTLRSSST